MTNQKLNEHGILTKKDFWQVYWRSFTLLGSFNYERMEGLGFLFSIQNQLRKIYFDDDEGYKAALHRHMEAFNMTVAPSPLVMGIALAMEENAKNDPNFDVSSINAVKVSLMGPLSGIGDTFFWGIFRVIACSLGISFAMQGNVLAPLVLLVTFNVPNLLTRYYCLKIGYTNGSEALTKLQKSGKMQLFTYCAGIVGCASMGCMIAAWIGIASPLVFAIGGQEIVIQEYLDQLLPQGLSLLVTMLAFCAIRKKVSTKTLICLIIVIGFILGVLGIIA